jgi:hypothetical protein
MLGNSILSVSKIFLTQIQFYSELYVTSHQPVQIARASYIENSNIIF